MKIYSQTEKIEYPMPCIALGNFDGLHLGHLKVISKAKENGDSFGVLLFDIHSNNAEAITSNAEKLEILEKIGVDFVVIVTFDDEFKNKSCREFAHFLKGLGVKSVSVGYDYRCGRGAKADCNDLKSELAEMGIGLVVTDPVEVDGAIVKSSKIREIIKEGNITLANKLLTRQFSLSGKVTEGKKNGRLMGFPTANLLVDGNKLLPKDGVYIGECFTDKAYKVIMNIGKNLTFNADSRTVEAHIIDFDADIYGKTLTVKLTERIRDCKKFSTPDELKKQLKADREYAIRGKCE